MPHSEQNLLQVFSKEQILCPKLMKVIPLSGHRVTLSMKRIITRGGKDTDYSEHFTYNATAYATSTRSSIVSDIRQAKTYEAFCVRKFHP